MSSHKEEAATHPHPRSDQRLHGDQYIYCVDNAPNESKEAWPCPCSDASVWLTEGLKPVCVCRRSGRIRGICTPLPGQVSRSVHHRVGRFITLEELVGLKHGLRQKRDRSQETQRGEKGPCGVTLEEGTRRSGTDERGFRMYSVDGLIMSTTGSPDRMWSWFNKWPFASGSGSLPRGGLANELQVRLAILENQNQLRQLRAMFPSEYCRWWCGKLAVEWDNIMRHTYGGI